ncbi:MAG: hypothetical protein AAGC44_13615 [Planctomycetota bacterium]
MSGQHDASSPNIDSDGFGQLQTTDADGNPLPQTAFGGAGQQPPDTPIAPGAAPDEPSGDGYDTPQEAVQDEGEGGFIEDYGDTWDKQFIEEGYTEVHYFRDSSGVKWTCPYNPTTQQYHPYGAHESSDQ